MSDEDRRGEQVSASADSGAASGADGTALVLDGPSQAGLAGLSPPERKAVVDHRRLARWGIRFVGALGAVVGTVILAQFVYYRFTGSMTNDAFVESHIVHLGPQQGGWLTRVVSAGDGCSIHARDPRDQFRVLAQLGPIGATGR